GPRGDLGERRLSGAQGVEILVVAVLGRLGRSQLVERTADLQQLDDRVAVDADPAHERVDVLLAGPARDEAAATVVDLDEAERLERADRLADAHTTDAERLAESPLRRDRVAGLQIAAFDRLEQLVADRLRAVDGLQGVELRWGGLGHGRFQPNMYVV